MRFPGVVIFIILIRSRYGDSYMSRTFVFYNPMLVASSRRQALLRRLETRLREGFAAQGQEVAVAPTLSAFSAGSQAAEAVAAQFFRCCRGLRARACRWA